MFSMNYNYQYVDWSHDPITGEPFLHKGNLVTNIITPTITIGLSDYFNISYQQTIGVRSMDWLGDSTSMHHQDGDTSTDFDNAHGSKFGDGTINLKYLVTNTGIQSGSRIFLGAGLIIPSKSVLTVNPFLENENGEALNEHRHYSLSDGCYKSNFEAQIYFKNNSKNIFIPSFYGLTANYIKPLRKSDYGYLSSDTYIIIGSSLFSTNLKPIWAPKGISLGLAYLKTEKAFWNGIEAPNSKTEVILPSIGIIWSHKDYGSFSLNIKYNQNETIPEDALNNKSTSIELSIGYRKTLNYTIPFLDDY